MDKLDFAYFCIGVGTGLRSGLSIKGFEGQLDFVDKCVKYFYLIEHLEEPEDGYTFSFPYQVAEPFGLRVAHDVSLRLDTPSALRHALAELIG